MSQHIERDPDKRIDSDRGTFDIEHEDAKAETGIAGLPRRDHVPEETISAIEQERTERLDPGNRPEQAEVDNTGRTFDAETGMFTDSEGYDQAERRFPADESQG